MTQLPGPLVKQFQNALMSAFPTKSRLSQMIRVQFGENLDAIAGGDNLSETVFNLIVQWAEPGGRTEELLTKARAEVLGSLELRELEVQYWQWKGGSPGLPAPPDTTTSSGGSVPPVVSSYNYDVFLSHNSSDKPDVEVLAHYLTRSGLKPFLDKWNLIPGDPWQEALEEALDQSSTCAVFLGPSGFGPWKNEEMRSALAERVRDKTRRVIPVLLPNAPDPKAQSLPRFLRRLTWVDFRRGLNDIDALHRLECGIKGVTPGP